MKAFLILEDGNVFTGTSIGSTREVISEIVFDTAMTGYLEVMTDPANAGLAVAMTYPLIGNYGITPDADSDLVWVDALIVKELSRIPSNFRCEGTIQDFLVKHDVPGIAGVDTRALTRLLREKGTMNGMITTDENYNIEEILPKLKAFAAANPMERLSAGEKKVLKAKGTSAKKVAFLDLGAASNLAESLQKRGCEVTVYPANTSAEELLAAAPDGIFVGNGAGDPKAYGAVVEEVKKLYASGKPMAGVGLGHLVIALAAGADTCKMKCGHRGGNYPVRDLETGRVYITAQNHGYAVDMASVDAKAAVAAFENVNDGTNEGLRYTDKNILTVQFLPESGSGSQDAAYVFDKIVEMFV